MKRVHPLLARLFWSFVSRRAALPVGITAIVAVIVMWWYGAEGVVKLWRETDQFGLWFSLLNLAAVLALWFFQMRNEWIAQLPKLLTVVLEKPHGEGVHVVVPYLPLTGESDIRAQAQTVLTGWYELPRLPLENIVYAVDEQGVFYDPSKQVNGGRPALFYRVRIRLIKENGKTSRLEGKLLIQPHAYLKVNACFDQKEDGCTIEVRATHPLENESAWQTGDPQVLPQDGNYEKFDGFKQDEPCGSFWLITRHPVALEWLKTKFNKVPDVVADHLDDALLSLLENAERDSVCVIGNLPLRLASAVRQKGAKYVNLDLNVPPEWRGRELSLDAFLQCNPMLRQYEVIDKGELGSSQEKKDEA